MMKTMKLNAIIKENRIINRFDLEDGIYALDIKHKGDSKTLEQTRKLWATIDDISRAEYGDISQSNGIYLQILKMSGIRTDKILINEEALEDLKKKTKALSIVSKETINHMPYVVVNVCFMGISEMSKQEVSQVIETAIKWASELGIDTELIEGENL